MTVPEARFAGPLAAMWPELSPARLASLLVEPADSLPVPSAVDRGVWTLGTGTADQAGLAAILARAEADLADPWPQPTATGYARYFRTGDRDSYEQSIFSRQRRLSRSVVAAAATLEPSWFDEVADGVVLLCEQSTWCWPAHDDTFSVHGSVLPTAAEPYLDLGAGEVVGQLAWLDHLLGAHLDQHVPGLRARIRHEARLRVFEPFLTRRDWHWLGLDGDVHNWNPWIHGNILVAALALLEPSELRSQLVDLTIQGLDRYVASLPEDGAVDEGYTYWWNGACRALEALRVLRHATRGRLDATAVPALRATVAFPHRMHLGGPWYLNLADGPARPSARLPWHALFRAAVDASDTQARAHATAHRTSDPDESEGLGRLLQALTDQDWLSAEPTSPPLPRDIWLPSIEVLVTREQAGSPSGLTLAAKAGHNGEHHNHNDVGSFVVALGGVPVVVDAGRPTYTAQTFGPDRYQLWQMQSSWHNVPEVRGTAQSAGAQFRARNIGSTIGDDGSALVLDLAPAYPRDDIRRWQRTAALDRGQHMVTVTDDWLLAEIDGEPHSVVHLLLAGEVTQAGPRSLLVEALEGAGTLAVDVSCGSVRTERRMLDDPWLTSAWGDHLTRAVVDLGTVPSGRCTVTFSPAGHPEEEVVR